MLNKKAIEIKNKIPDITNLTTKAALARKAAKVESEIPKITNITNFAATAASDSKDARIKNKTLDTSGFITTLEFNRLKKSLDAKITEISKLLSNRKIKEILDI